MPPRPTHNTLPLKPGVYLFHNAQDEVLYVGKAKSLKRRVASYFQNGRALEPSKRIMVGRIARIEYIVTTTEHEALLLESTLIKRHRPPFNVVFRDDKSFLFIKVTLGEEYPTIATSRRLSNDGSRYFGPYTSAASVHATLKLLKRIFAYRTCTPHTGKPCFDVHLGRCLGPCANAITPNDYQQRVVDPILAYLSGRTGDVIRKQGAEMERAARRREFERAAMLRDRVHALRRVAERQAVISPKRERYDVVSLARDRGWTAVNLFRVREGKLQEKQSFLLQQPQEASDGEILGSFAFQFYSLAPDRPRELVTRVLLKNASEFQRLLGVHIQRAERGKKRRLADLGTENAREYLERRKAEWLSDTEKARRALEGLTTALELASVPRRIEAFDISNIQGTNAVGSMVVFENGLAKKDAYRKFTITHAGKPDDTAMLAEVVRRRLLRSDWPVANLILLDGGKGQLSTVLRATHGFPNRPTMVALAKREEELFLPDNNKPVMLPKDSETLFLIQRLRDEAHRFAITFYRGKHRKATTRSIFDDVPGIGPKTKRQLLRRFGSLAGIRKAKDRELIPVIGQAKTNVLRDYLGEP